MIKKILWLSDSPITSTGFGTMTLNILNGLSNHNYECHCVCHNLAGQDVKPGLEFADGTKVNFWLHGTGKESYARDKVMFLLKSLKPEIFGVLLDTFMLKQSGFDGLNFSPARSIFYYPTDGEYNLPHTCENLFLDGTFQYPIAMSKHGREQVKTAHKINAHYIPHAVNHNIFKKFDNEKYIKNKQKWGQKLGLDLTNRQIIGCVARNQGRKMLDRQLAIMKYITQYNPNAIMLMHTDPTDNAGYFDMLYQVKQQNLENRVFFTGLNYLCPFTYEEISEIYNLFDIFMLSTTGEGFGVPIIEAMACEVPCLITNYTTTKELVLDNNAGLGIELVGNYINELKRFDGEILGSWEVFRGVCSIEDGGKKAIQMLSNPEQLKTWGKNGRIAVEREYTWDVVIPQWYEYFEKICGDY